MTAYKYKALSRDGSKVSGVVDPEKFSRDMEESFHHKFATKPQVIEGNMRALKRSMEEVQVG